MADLTIGQFPVATGATEIGTVPLPFFGASMPWVRPTLDIGGAGSHFNTWLHQGVATASNGANGAPLILTDPITGGTTNLVGLLTDLPAAPYTVTALIALPMVAFANPAQGIGQIFLYNSGSDKAVSLMWYNLLNINGSIAAPAQVLHYPNTNSAAGNSIITATVVPQYVLWMRIVNDGTNIMYYVSYENLRYRLLLSETVVSVGYGTFDKVGFGVDEGFSQGVDINDVVLWDFRITSP